MENITASNQYLYTKPQSEVRNHISSKYDYFPTKKIFLYFLPQSTHRLCASCEAYTPSTTKQDPQFWGVKQVSPCKDSWWYLFYTQKFFHSWSTGLWGPGSYLFEPSFNYHLFCLSIINLGGNNNFVWRKKIDRKWDLRWGRVLYTMLRNLEFGYNLSFHLPNHIFFQKYFLKSHYCATKVIWVTGGVTEGFSHGNDTIL